MFDVEVGRNVSSSHLKAAILSAKWLDFCRKFSTHGPANKNTLVCFSPDSQHDDYLLCSECRTSGTCCEWCWLLAVVSSERQLCIGDKNTECFCYCYYYFASAAVGVDSSRVTASSSASWTRFSPLHILLIGMCRQCGSWSVAGHNHKKVIMLLLVTMYTE